MQIATSYHVSDEDVRDMLQALGLDRRRLISVGAVALASSRRASALHAANARGTFAYHDGVEALRYEFIGRHGWASYAVGGLEGIYNVDRKAIILFKTMEHCCNEFKQPNTRSRIGVNSERICGLPLFDSAGVLLPEIQYAMLPDATHVKTSKYTVYYLMLDRNGNLELGSPVIIDSVIVGFKERIFLALGEELDLDVNRPVTDEEQMDGDEFVIEVKRKNEQ